MKKKAKSNASNAQRSASAPAPKQKRQKVDVLAEWTGLVASEKVAQRVLDKIHAKQDRMRDRARKLMGNLFDRPAKTGGRRKVASSRRAASGVKGKSFRVNHDGTKSMALQIAEQLEVNGIGGMSPERLKEALPGNLTTLTINKMIKAGDVERQSTANGDRLVLTNAGKDKLTISNAKLAEQAGGSSANEGNTDTRNAATSGASASGF